MSFVIAVPLHQLFVDRGYQRELDEARAKRMAAAWNPELVGVLDVSDRGAHASPRYAVINGQHRAAAARLVDPSMQLPVNVHVGLTVEQEAKLFFAIDRGTKALSTWDRWYARRAAGDRIVAEIERVAGECGYVVTQNPGRKHIQCASTLERIWERHNPVTLAKTLTLVSDVWLGLPDSVSSPIVEAIAWLVDVHDADLNTGRLADAMSDITPRQVRARASAMRESGTRGSLASVCAHVLTGLYNKTRGDGGRLTPINTLARNGRGS